MSNRELNLDYWNTPEAPKVSPDLDLGYWEGTEPTQPADAGRVLINYSTEDYSTSDLTKDEFFNPILNYMSDRFGTHFDFNVEKGSW